MGDWIARIGIDSGGGSLKITLNIVSNKAPDPATPQKKRQKHVDKDSGEKKLFILALVPNISEDYNNMEKLLTYLDLSSIASRISYAMDLKMVNILVGIQAHGSTFPCCFCTWRSGNKGEEYIKKNKLRPKVY